MARIYFFVLTFIISISTYAQITYSVSSQIEFDNALTISTTGDTIEWESGTYSNIFMDITKDGVTVRPVTIGEVIFNGASRVEIDGDNVTFSGFQYIGGDIGTSHVVRIYGNNVLFTEVNILNYTCYKYLIIQNTSQYSVVSYCNFENRINTPDQNILSILVSETQAGYHKVQYCSFKDFIGDPSVSAGDAGVEPIRIGVSTTATYESKSIVEYCYFTQCNGDGEIISHKATQCVYRYNTFDDNPVSELVLRHGDAGIVYGNFFTNGMGGVRIQEASDHIIFNNYFSGLTNRSLNLNNGSTDRLDNIIFVYNTVIDSAPIDMENGTNEAENIIIANNIFSNTSGGELFEDITGNETWIGNITNGTLGITTPASGTNNIDPQLTLNTEGYYEIASSSSAIDASVIGYPILPTYAGLDYDNDILLDLVSSTRPSAITSKDVGCQEYDPLAVIEPHVTADNTGPTYLMLDPTLSNADFIKNLGSDLIFYPNPVDKEITFSFNFNINTSIEVDVYDISGAKITSLINDNFNRGAQAINKVINLNTGVYLISTIVKDSSGKSTTKTEKLLKL